MTDQSVNALRLPFAVIARIRNDSPAQHHFLIFIDNHTVCDPMVAAHVTRRIDCALTQDWDPATEHEVVIESPATSWRLEYLELATHHGNSTGGLTLYVLPAASKRYTPPTVVWLFVVWLALTGVLLLPSSDPTSPSMRFFSRGLASAVIALFGLVMIAPIVSPYLIVLSAWTFAGWLFLSLVPRLSSTRIAAWSWRAFDEVWRICVDDRRLAWLLSVSMCGVGLIYGSHAVGAADTYGYVSEADLWLRGNLRIEQPFAKQAPWPQPEWTFTPLGYRPHPVDDRVIVPIYSPGLPMILAVAKLLGGQDAMFCVVPLCGGLLVLATYGLGLRLGSGWVGLIGAWLVATSPVALAHTLTTMTDVPVAAAWAAAFYLLLGTNLSSAAGAGLLSSVAILIRPNLAPLAAVMGMQYAFRMRDAKARSLAVGQLLVFGMAALPGALAVAAINQYLFGSPLVSGYGRLDNLFAWTRVPANLRNYLGWLVDAHTPVVLCGLAAILVPLRRLWPGTPDRSVFIVIGTFVIALWTIYCAWLVFDTWYFSRFLLSSWPFIMLGVAAVAMALFRTAVPFIKPAVVCSVIALGIVQIQIAANRAVFGTGWVERRNVVVAQMAQRVTAPNSVIVSGIHSGSLRYYAGRMTLNYVWLDRKWLDGAVEWLGDNGVHTYALLEDWEMPEFRRRFAGARRLAALEQPPVGIYDDPGKSMVFDLSESRSPSATPVIVRGINAGWSAVPPVSPPQLVFVRVP
jgi:4-amino-4-deoxy-L-arabinose transferase-like glycosyltransferase